MDNKMIIKVEGASMYSFTDDKSGRLVQGVNVFHMVEGSENSVGRIPSKISLPYETWNSISSFPFPCDCEVVTDQIFTRKGIVTKVVGLKFVK